MGGMIEPVTASGSWPACTARVAMPPSCCSVMWLLSGWCSGAEGGEQIGAGDDADRPAPVGDEQGVAAGEGGTSPVDGLAEADQGRHGAEHGRDRVAAGAAAAEEVVEHVPLVEQPEHLP